jgi:uncharacterized RDD family membrane protein YckC
MDIEPDYTTTQYEPAYFIERAGAWVFDMVFCVAMWWCVALILFIGALNAEVEREYWVPGEVFPIFYWLTECLIGASLGRLLTGLRIRWDRGESSIGLNITIGIRSMLKSIPMVLLFEAGVETGTARLFLLIPASVIYIAILGSILAATWSKQETIYDRLLGTAVVRRREKQSNSNRP